MFVLDPDKARLEMAARGLNQRRWSELAGVHRITLTKALGGRPCTFNTYVRLTQALDRMPKLPLPDLYKIGEPVSRSRNGRGRNK